MKINSYWRFLDRNLNETSTGPMKNILREIGLLRSLEKYLNFFFEFLLKNPPVVLGKIFEKNSLRSLEKYFNGNPHLFKVLGKIIKKHLLVVIKILLKNH